MHTFYVQFQYGLTLLRAYILSIEIESVLNPSLGIFICVVWYDYIVLCCSISLYYNIIPHRCLTCCSYLHGTGNCFECVWGSSPRTKSVDYPGLFPDLHSFLKETLHELWFFIEEFVNFQYRNVRLTISLDEPLTKEHNLHNRSNLQIKMIRHCNKWKALSNFLTLHLSDIKV